jgi:hypothetical protein
VDHVPDETRQPGDAGNVEPERLSSQGLEDVVEVGLLEEAHLDELDVGEVVHELELDAHVARERHVLEQDRHRSADEALSDFDLEDDLGVGLELLLPRGDVREVGRRERQLPVHDDDVVRRLGVRSNAVDSRSLGSEGEGSHLDALEESRGAGREDVVDGGDNGSRKNGLVDFPKPVQEVVDPVGRLVLGDQSSLDELTLDVVAGGASNTSDGDRVVRRADGTKRWARRVRPGLEVLLRYGEDSQKNGRPTETQAKDRKEVRGRDGEEDDSGVLPPGPVRLLRPAMEK